VYQSLNKIKEKRMGKGEIKIKKEHQKFLQGMNDRIDAFQSEIETLISKKHFTHNALWGFLLKYYDLDDNKGYNYDFKSGKIIEIADKNYTDMFELRRKWNKFAEENKISITDLVKQ
jgi:hypothetical protein